MAYDKDFMSRPATTASFRDAQARAAAPAPVYDPAEPAEFLLNRPPAPTWNRLGMNDAAISVEAPGAPAEGAVAFSVPAQAKSAQIGVLDTSVPDAGDAALADAFDRELASSDINHTFEMGSGADATEWLRVSAARKVIVVVPDDTQVAEPLVVDVDAVDKAHSVAAVDVVVGAGSSLTVNTCTDSPAGGTGFAGTLVRVVAKPHARVTLNQVQTLDSAYQNIDDVGVLALDDAHVAVQQIVLGAQQHFTGTAVDLEGLRSSCDVDVRYLGHGSDELDFNYTLRQRGAKTRTYTFANGVLSGSSQKLLRDTIDLIHGGKGAVGREKETVLLTDDGVRNKSLPAILCDEDDVQGDHGASIGHVNPAQRDYMATRGLSGDQIDALFESAMFDYAADHAHDAHALAAVNRLATSVLGHKANEEA